MRHGKYFKLVHLSCSDMGREGEFFMFIEKKQRERKRERRGEEGKEEKAGVKLTKKVEERKEKR